MNFLNKYTFLGLIIFILVSGTLGCRDKEDNMDEDLLDIIYNPIPYDLTLPSYFPKIENPADNPLTKDGVILGQHLFYDPILSADSTMSCSSCHFPEKSFTDGKAVSIGIDNIAGTKSSMSIINLAFTYSGFFWDGRSATLEEQALLPVEDPIELHNDWIDLEKKLQSHPTYPEKFRKAFGIKGKKEISKELVANAISQFERIIVTYNSKYDRVKRGEDIYDDLEFLGDAIFFDDDPDQPDGECNHCHNDPMMTSDDFFNNGFQTDDGNLQFPDNGRGLITNNKADNGKFKAPTLRNIMLTAPYMHDGSLATIDDVLEHYNSGGHPSVNKDPLIYNHNFTKRQLDGLKAFMNSLTDTSYMSNSYIINPYK